MSPTLTFLVIPQHRLGTTPILMSQPFMVVEAATKEEAAQAAHKHGFHHALVVEVEVLPTKPEEANA